MMLRRVLGSLLVVAFVGGCGPRLRRPSDAQAAAPVAADAPVADMSVEYDQSKLGPDKKYTEDGQFKVKGLFFKDGEPLDAPVSVALVQAGEGQLSRSYAIDLSAVAGSAARVEMWDDGFLTVVIPSDSPMPGFETSNQNIRAAALEVPGQEPSTCYFSKQILEGQLRFALCDLQTEIPRLAFVDAVPDAPSSSPEAAPAQGAPPAAGAAPAEGATPAEAATPHN